MALRYAVRVNGMTHLAITKLDVLDAMDDLSICTGYELDGAVTRDFPTQLDAVERVKPVYERMPGWKASTREARSWADLPPQCIAYIARIEEVLRVPVALVSVGADRTATFSRLAIWEGL